MKRSQLFLKKKEKNEMLNFKELKERKIALD